MLIVTDTTASKPQFLWVNKIKWFKADTEKFANFGIDKKAY